MSKNNNCRLCPRECGVDRTAGPGVCGAMAVPVVSRAALHLWEEPVISAAAGSGTVFFCGCNLHCVFCQNHTISRGRTGKELDAEGLCRLYFKLKEQGAANINLVSPMHHIDVAAESIELAKKRGVGLPFVWNTNAYEKIDSLKTLEGLVDIYLPDLKYVSDTRSVLYSGVADYFKYASAAVLEMYRQAGTLRVENGMAKSGLIIRHLALPGNIDQSRMVLDWIAANLPKNTSVSLMRQYVPDYLVPVNEKYKSINRRLTKREYDRAVEYALSLGLTEILIQSGEAADKAYTPSFDGTGL